MDDFNTWTDSAISGYTYTCTHEVEKHRLLQSCMEVVFGQLVMVWEIVNSRCFVLGRKTVHCSR